MMHFRYELQTADGGATAGVIAAATAAEASQKLRARGRIVSIRADRRAGRQSLGERLKELNHTSGPSMSDIQGFTTELAVMIRAGISLRSAIEGIAEQAENPRFRNLLETIKADVEGGQSFSDALAKHPKYFNALYVNMVRASEMSGSFARMLDRIAAYLAQQMETRAMVRGAMIYPATIFTMAVGTTIFLLTFVLPKFAGVFEGKEHLLPWPTIFLMSLSDFMVDFWWAVVLGIAGLLGGLFALSKTQTGRVWFDQAKLSAPIFRKMFRALYISRSLHTMGELINAGVPMLDTLSITGDISGNVFYRGLWRRVHNAVKQGRKISSELLKTHLLPRNVVQMVSAGEESGKLGEVLDEISTYYAKQLRDAIKTVTSMIEPIMIVFMGSVVGFIAMAIILPIFKMSSLVK